MRLAVSVWLGTLFILAIATPQRGHAAPTNPAPALNILKYDLAANQDTPQLCFLLSETVARQPGTPLEAYVGTIPAAKLSVTPRNNRLCVTGFAFGNTYTVTIKAGLPGVSGVLAQDLQYRIAIPNRPPELDFSNPSGDVLPRAGAKGLPIRSVNIPKIAVEILRISDRDLLPMLLTPPGAGQPVIPDTAHLVWQGTIDTKNPPNSDIVTMLPLETTIGNFKPGRYVAIAWPAGMPMNPGKDDLPSQYFSISDLGLITYRGAEGLLVAVRSLSSAQAASDVEIALIGRNNRELARIRTDINGFARFDAGILHGSGGDRPAAIYAYGPTGDFSAINIGDSATVASGASNPTLQKALIQTDRPTYRPGDTANLTVLLRNRSGSANSKQTLTLKITRPDGVIANLHTLTGESGDSYKLAVPLSAGGQAGIWLAEVFDSMNGPSIGTSRFTVEPTVPAPLSISLRSDSALLDPSQPSPVEVQALDPTGQPSANAPGTVRVTLTASPVPFPAFPNFTFGSAEEPFEPLSLEPIRFTSDSAGKANIMLKLGVPPKTTKPVEAIIAASMLDAAGRTTTHAVDIPVANQGLLLGIRPVAPSVSSPPVPPPNDNVFPEGAPVHFEIIAVSPDGARQEKNGAGWEIVREEISPFWHRQAGRFTYRPGLKPAHVIGGVVEIPPNMPATVDANLPSGLYRIETFDPKGEAMSSVRFKVGSTVPDDSYPADPVAIRLAKPFYAPGENAEIFVRPPYESDVILVMAGRQISDAIAQHILPSGGSMRINVPDDASAGVTLYATAVAPPNASSLDLPRRSSGNTGLGVDPALDRLEVRLDIPDKTAPQHPLTVPVTVTGAGDETVFVKVTAVDDRGPKSESKNNLAPTTPQGIDSHGNAVVSDLYGRIITPIGISGDASSARPAAYPSPTSAQNDAASFPNGQTVALISDALALDKSGKGTVTLALPDFTGKLRIQALAWSASRRGEAEMTIPVHYPLAVTLPLPRFLGPDDHVSAGLALDNVDGPRGEYKIRVRANGALSIQEQDEIVVNLAEHEQRTLPINIQARGPGEGSVILSVQGPNNMAFEQKLPVDVRPGAPPVSRHATLSVKPGAPLSIDPSLTSGLRPDTISVSLIAGAGSDFDLRGLARQLLANPDVSCDQIIGAVMPYLTPEALLPALGLKNGGNDGGARMKQAVQKLAELQQSDGGFSLWANGRSDPWMTAYVADFLGQAKTIGQTLPEEPLRRALDYLARHNEPQIQAPANPADARQFTQASLEVAAYATKVLAANGRLTIFDLRYFADTFVAQMRSPVSVGWVAAAYAALGDKSAAATLFTQATALPSPEPAPDEFASDLRDAALLTTLMAESQTAPPSAVTASAAKSAALAMSHRQFSIQEASWLFRAQVASLPNAAPIKLRVGDKALEQTMPFTIGTTDGDTTPLPTIRNAGNMPLRVEMTVSGVPLQPEVKEGPGYEIQRSFFDQAGKPIDPTTIRQDELLLVVLTGRFTGEHDAHPLLIDPVPAGWDVVAAELTNPASRYPWLKDLGTAAHIEIKDGRYIAAPNLTGDRHEFKLAYVVRAALRGQFTAPGATIEDMVQPALSGRTANSRTKIEAAP
jgi:uncharacterized protein YfaS (alpha-2-macroglobulin family)